MLQLDADRLHPGLGLLEMGYASFSGSAYGFPVDFDRQLPGTKNPQMGSYVMTDKNTMYSRARTYVKWKYNFSKENLHLFYEGKPWGQDRVHEILCPEGNLSNTPRGDLCAQYFDYRGRRNSSWGGSLNGE